MKTPAALPLFSLTMKSTSWSYVPSVALAHANVMPAPFTLVQLMPAPWAYETSTPSGRCCACAPSGPKASDSAAAMIAIRGQLAGLGWLFDFIISGVFIINLIRLGNCCENVIDWKIFPCRYPQKGVAAGAA